MTNIRILSAAGRDLQEAFDWYLERSIRAADRFENEVERVFRAIQDDPERFPKWDSRHCFILLKRFPYYVAYRIETDGVLVVAVRHAARETTEWKDR